MVSGQLAGIRGNPAVADDGGARQPVWGSGGFVVEQRGDLTLALLIFSGSVEIKAAGKATISESAISSSTTAPAIEVQGGGAVSIDNCNFTLTGSGIVLHDDARATVEASRFGTMCPACRAISVSGSDAAQVTVTSWLDERSLRSSVDFDLCLESSADGRPQLRNAPNCPPSTTTTSLTLQKDTGIWGSVIVDNQLNISGSANRLPAHTVVSATFVLGPAASFTGAHLDFQKTAANTPIFTGAGAISVSDCDRVSATGEQAAMTTDCCTLTFANGRVRGKCDGALGDVCSFLSCVPGYTMSAPPLEARCMAGGAWSAAPPECTPNACGDAVVVQSDRVGSNACKGMLGDVCAYTCNTGYTAMGQQVCGTDGHFVGGVCRVDALCADSPTWTDTQGHGCAAQPRGST